MANFYKKSPSTGKRAAQAYGGDNEEKKSSQLGRSMIEMLGVLAIIGVLSIGGIAGYSKAMTKHNINKAIEQISMIITNVQTLFSNTNDYSALREKALSLGIFPDDMEKIDERSAYNVFGQDVYVEGHKRDWFIQYHVPSLEACIAILTQNWGEISSFTGMVAGNTKYIFSKTPISAFEAEKACKESESVNRGSIFFVLYFR